MYGQWSHAAARCARRDPDPTLPAVGNDQAAAVASDPAHLQRFGKTTDASDVRLEYINKTTVSQVEELESSVLPLAGGNRNR